MPFETVRVNKKVQIITEDQEQVSVEFDSKIDKARVFHGDVSGVTHPDIKRTTHFTVTPNTIGDCIVKLPEGTEWEWGKVEEVA